jgi:CheY-like chemotaxis protein
VQQQPTALQQQASTDDKAGDLPTLLIIEDNQQLQYYLQDLFKDEYQVVLAENGKIGLEHAIEHIPDLIVSDIMMPVMDGYQLLDEVKSHSATNHIPVILLTAKSDKHSLLKGLKYRADDYLSKPFDDQVLRLKLANLLHLRNMWHQRYLAADTEQTGAIVMQFNPAQQAFIDKLNAVCEQHYQNGQFGIDELEEQMNMSKRQLQRKVKALCGTTPLSILKEVRLEKARVAIENGEQITQVAYSCGFNSYDVFSRAFKEKYQLSPKQYLAFIAQF